MIEKYGTILNVENELIHTFTVFKLHFKAAKQWFIPIPYGYQQAVNSVILMAL